MSFVWLTEESCDGRSIVRAPTEGEQREEQFKVVQVSHFNGLICDKSTCSHSLQLLQVNWIAGNWSYGLLLADQQQRSKGNSKRAASKLRQAIIIRLHSA